MCHVVPKIATNIGFHISFRRMCKSTSWVIAIHAELKDPRKEHYHCQYNLQERPTLQGRVTPVTGFGEGRLPLGSLPYVGGEDALFCILLVVAGLGGDFRREYEEGLLERGRL